MACFIAKVMNMIIVQAIAQFQVTGNFSKRYPNEVYVHMQTHIKHG